MLHTLLFAGALALVADFLAPDTYHAELWASFRPWISLGLIALAICFLFGGRRIGGAVALSLALVHAAGTAAPLWAADTERVAEGSTPTVTLRVLTANVSTRNHDAGGLVRLIEELSPDIITLQDARAPWAGVLARTGRFPSIRTSGDLIVASRFPFDESAATGGRGGTGHPILRVRVRVRPQDGSGAAPVVVYTAHPRSPRSPEAWMIRNETLAHLASAVADEPDDLAVIVTGDLNASPWSAHFQRLLARSGLSGGGSMSLLRPTYFAKERGWPDWLGVPIDHVLVRAPALIASRQVAGPIGSDHLPVFTEIELPLHVD